jgi:branched-chain amino acid aminotransferase
MTIWLNGRLLPDGMRAIDAADRGLTLGDGLFETLRARAGQPVLAERHFARLREGARLLDIPILHDEHVLAAEMAELLAASGIAEGALRLTLTRGPAPRGVLPPAEPRPTLLMTAAALPPPAGPARLILASVTRRNEHSPLSRLKSLNYLDNILARQEAAARGADDALLLNLRGAVTESSIANLFLVLDGALVTPPLADGVLPGIARGLMIERCGAAERSILPEELARAEAGFLSNSLGLRPIAAIEGRELEAPGAAFETCRALLETAIC